MNANNSNYISEQGDLPDYLELAERAIDSDYSRAIERATAFALIAQAQDQRRRAAALERIAAVLEKAHDPDNGVLGVFVTGIAQ